MNEALKRVVALALAGVMLFAFAACKNGGNTENQQVADGQLFAEGTVIKLTTASHPSWPYKEDWVIWKYMEEGAGVKLEVNAIPNSDFATKVNLMMASPDALPDILRSSSKADTDAHASSGAFIPLSKNFDKMPNFMKLLDEMDEEKRTMTLAERRSGDGEIYMAQVVGEIIPGNGRSWLYRRDIFEKHNLKVPTSEEELFDVARKLKELYPDSYPLCFRQGLTNICVMGSMWKPYFDVGFYYDYNGDDGKWHYGAVEDTMKDIIAFFQKMSDEQLVPPDFLTIPTNSWQEYMTTDRGFMMSEYLVRIPFFNNLCRSENPEYDMAVMAPPLGGTIANFRNDPGALVVCNTGDEQRIDNAIRFIDWMYSDEGFELLAWGKEGETYEVLEDGSRRMILAEGEAADAKYGIGTMSTYLRVTPETTKAVVEPGVMKEYEKGITYANEYFNPTMWLSFNDDERDIYDEYYTALDTYRNEMLSKFMLKQIPMSEWDSFVKTCEELGLNELLEIHTAAYNRAIGK